MKFLQKFLSATSSIAIMMTLLVVPANAAAISVSAARVDDNTMTITLTGLTGNITNTDDFNVTIKTLDDGTDINISTATAVHGDNGSFAETAYNTTGLNLTADGVAGTPSKVITLTSAGLFTTAEDYTVAVSVIAGTQNIGDFGLATVIASTQNQVTVTATVEPTLTFNLDANAIALATLSPGSFSTGNVTYDIATNAVSGVDVVMTSTGLDNGTNEIGQNNLDGTGANEATSTYYKVSTNATPVFDTATDILTDAAGAQMTSPVTLYDGSAPAALNNQLVTIGAQVAATTPAGNYTDTLTFSATATY